MEEKCIRCNVDADGGAIILPKFNIFGLDEGKLCAGCQQELLRIEGVGIKAHGTYTRKEIE